MNVVRSIEKLNEHELEHGTKRSWHDDYKHSAYIFIGGLDSKLTEGDILVVFSQFGEPVDLNLVRDQDTGQSKGFAFLAYEDQRSTNLAVDNFNGASLVGRTLRVDHVKDYEAPELRQMKRMERKGKLHEYDEDEFLEGDRPLREVLLATLQGPQGDSETETPSDDSMDAEEGGTEAAKKAKKKKKRKSKHKSDRKSKKGKKKKKKEKENEKEKEKERRTHRTKSDGLVAKSGSRAAQDPVSSSTASVAARDGAYHRQTSSMTTKEDLPLASSPADDRQHSRTRDRSRDSSDRRYSDRRYSDRSRERRRDRDSYERRSDRRRRHHRSRSPS